MYVCPPCVCLVPVDIRDVVRSLGTEVIDGSEPVFEYWKLNLGPMKEQHCSKK